MGALATLTTHEVIDRVLGDGTPGHRDVRGELVAANDAAWAATIPRLLELCRIRMAVLLGCEAEVRDRTGAVDDDLLDSIAAWPNDSRFTGADRAALAFAEHYIIDVASIDDSTVAAVRGHLGDVGLQNFVSALLVVEQRIRLRLMWERLFGGER